MIKNSLINSTWNLEVLDDTDTVINSATFVTQWLDNFTEAFTNGARSPLGNKKFDAIKFGYGQSPTIAGMTGIENLVIVNDTSWPITDDLNLTNTTSYNPTTNTYTKTSVETGTLLAGSAGQLPAGAVIREVGGAYIYNYDTDKYTDGNTIVNNWLDPNLLSNLYSQVQAKYNPLCATRGLIVDGSNQPVSLTIQDGHKLRYTITTELEFKIDISLTSGSQVIFEGSGPVATTTTFEFTPYTDIDSFIGNCGIGEIAGFARFAGIRVTSSTAETAYATVPFVYNYTNGTFIINPDNSYLVTDPITDIQYIDITDAGNTGESSELVLARITFNPPVAPNAAIQMDLSLVQFAEPKFVTTPGNPAEPVFAADPNLTLFPNWNIAKTVFPGKNLNIVTDTTAQTISLVHNSNSYTYSYASGSAAPGAAIDLDIGGNVVPVMSPDAYTVGYFAPVIDDTTYYFDGSPSTNTTINMTLRDSENINNFVTQTITLDVTRPTYNPLSTGPFLALGIAGGSQKVVCTDLSNYSLVPAAEGITDNPVVIKYSPDGSLVAIGFDIAPYFRVYDANTWAPIPDTIPTISGFVNDLAFSPDGAKLCIAHNNFGNYTVLNTSDWTTYTKPSVTSQCMTAKFSNDGNYLALGHTAGKRLSVIDVNTWTLVAGTPTLPGVCVTIDWNTDGTRLACGHFLGSYLTVLDTADWSVISGPISDGNIPSLEYNPDGSQLAIMNGLDLKILSAADWSVLHTKRLPGEGLRLQYNPDGSVLGVMHSQGNRLSLFNTATWDAIPDTTWLDGYDPRSLCFRPVI